MTAILTHTTTTTPITAPSPAPTAAAAVLVQRAYPPLGCHQHMTIIRDGKSERGKNPQLFLELGDLPQSVLAGDYFPQQRMMIPTPIPGHERILLPPLRTNELRAERVWDGDGQRLGMLVNVPALFVHANQITLNYYKGNERYDYRRAVGSMCKESGRLLASVLRSGVLRCREKPGLMAHAYDFNDLKMDEVCISEGYALKLLPQVLKQAPQLFAAFPDAARLVQGGTKAAPLNEGEREMLAKLVYAVLDGFPVWSIRFPLANRHGISPAFLRLVPGKRRFIGIHPWVLGKRKGGDADGDLLFLILRVRELLEGKHEQVRRAPVVPNESILPGMFRSRLTLGSLFDSEQVATLPDVTPKMYEKYLSQAHPAIGTLEERLAAIEAADTRQHVAVYTMAIGWWISRILAVQGQLDPQTAYQQAYDCLEFFMENSMDARKLAKALSAFVGSQFDAHEFMDVLLNGGIPDWSSLTAIGLEADDLATLKTAWSLSGGNLRSAVGNSPVYSALVLQKSRMDVSVVQMMQTLRRLGIPAEELYDAVVDDLSCVKPLCMPEDGAEGAYPLDLDDYYAGAASDTGDDGAYGSYLY